MLEIIIFQTKASLHSDEHHQPHAENTYPLTKTHIYTHKLTHFIIQNLTNKQYTHTHTHTQKDDQV